MKVIIESANDLCEVENLLMMADSCQRHFNHSHAVRAVKALRTARNEYIEKVMPLFIAGATDNKATLFNDAGDW